MKTHSEIGYRIAMASPELMPIAVGPGRNQAKRRITIRPGHC